MNPGTIRGPRRTPFLKSGWVAMLFATSATGASGAPLPAAPLIAMRSDPDSTASHFEIRRIPRSEFLPARALPQPRPRKIGVDRTAGAERTPGRKSYLWDNLAVGLSGNHATSPRSSSGNQTRTSVRAARLIPLGALDLDFEFARRGGATLLPRAGMKLDTFRGWRFRLGDVASMTGGPAGRGLTARGFGAERSLPLQGIARDLRFGILAGWAPVQYANLLHGSFPRKLIEGLAVSRISSVQEMTAEAFAVSESRQSSDVSWRALRNGGGVGLSTSLREGPSSLFAELFHSRIRFADGPLATGSEIHLRGRSRRSNVGMGLNLERSGGEAYHAGPYGSLQPVPRSILDCDLSYRAPSGWSSGIWGGTWRQIPLPDGSIAAQPDAQRDLHNRAFHGRQWGLRAGGTLPRLGTGVTLTQEWRWRTLSDRGQEIRASKISFDQRISRELRCSLQLNSLGESGARRRNYVTGSASIGLDGGAVLAVQQQTVWQEPLGAQLLTTVELSSLRLRSGRIIVGGSATQVHEERSGRFHPSQTQAAVNGRLRINAAAELVVRYQMSVGASQRYETFEIGFTHAIAASREGLSSAASDPVLNPRPLLGGIVFEDLNGDGIRQGDEPGIPDIRVIVDNDIHEPVICDEGGRYRTSVSIGRHQVRLLPESIPACYSIDGIETVDVDAAPESPAACNFPLVRLAGVIEGSIQHGDVGGPEPVAGARAIENVRIILDGVQFTYSDAHGRFAFRHLAAGEHSVRIDPSSLPLGYRVEGEPTRRVVVTRSAVSVATCEFRLFRPVQRKSF
jgi:hypothetical protein